MNKKILETLEFNKVNKALFEPHLLTEQGLSSWDSWLRLLKRIKIKRAFAEMKEMQALFVEQPHFTILATKEIAVVCKRLEMGADLNIEGSTSWSACFLLAENCKVLLQSGKC